MLLLLPLLLAPLISCQPLPSCTCRPKSVCIGHFASLAAAAATSCPLPGGVTGFCCQDVLAREDFGVGLRSSEDEGRATRRPATEEEETVMREFLDSVRISTTRPRTSSVDKETLGHSIFGKPRKADADIEEAALKLFFLGQDLQQSGDVKESVEEYEEAVEEGMEDYQEYQENIFEEANSRVGENIIDEVVEDIFA